MLIFVFVPAGAFPKTFNILKNAFFSSISPRTYRLNLIERERRLIEIFDEENGRYFMLDTMMV